MPILAKNLGMKKFKKTLLFIVLFLITTSVLGYFYFDQKFTPDKNYLNIKNESEKILIKWDNEKQSMFLPIKIQGDTTTYFMQFDTGSHYTIFYEKSIKNILKIKFDSKNKTCETQFSLGNTQVFSNNFKTIDYGEKINASDSIKLIGTIGSDILEVSKTLINFRENYIVFNLNKTPKNFNNKLFDFKFKKRRIIIPAELNNKQENFLYDSGSSAFELITNKEIWENLKTPQSKIKIESGNSWGNILKTYTAESNNFILFNKTKIPLKEVTHIEGYSIIQYSLMKFSGMSGMLGNKIFLKNSVFIDTKENKMGID